MIVERFRGSSYFGGSTGRGSLGYLKYSACGGTVSGLWGTYQFGGRFQTVASSIRAPQSVGAWSTLRPTSPYKRDFRGQVSLRKSSALHTIRAHHESEGLIRVAVGAVGISSNIPHNNSRFINEVRMIDDSHRLGGVGVVSLGSSQPPGIGRYGEYIRG